MKLPTFNTWFFSSPCWFIHFFFFAQFRTWPVFRLLIFNFVQSQVSPGKAFNAIIPLVKVWFFHLNDRATRFFFLFALPIFVSGKFCLFFSQLEHEFQNQQNSISCNSICLPLFWNFFIWYSLSQSFDFKFLNFHFSTESSSQMIASNAILSLRNSTIPVCSYRWV